MTKEVANGDGASPAGSLQYYPTRLIWSRLADLHAELGTLQEQRLRFTYDRGALEIMTLGHHHEHWAKLIARLIEIFSMELGIPIKSGKSTTFRRRRKLRGLEADECYWVANESLVRGLDHLDLRRDPPPDLAIEVEITTSCLNRMAIYAALRIPEIWRFDGKNLTFHFLDSSGNYATTAASKAFSQLTPNDLMPFLDQRGQVDETSLLIQFQAWVRTRFGKRSQATP